MPCAFSEDLLLGITLSLAESGCCCLQEGHYIVAADWKKNEHMTEDMFCDEFHLVDLRVYDNCLKVR